MRYFVAVAEELNFTRAAERLGLAQPPLSRAIGQLERRLGVRLFERNTRRVTLTVAGRTLLEEASGALEVMSAAARRTRRAGSSEPILAVTAKPGLASGLLRRIVEAYTSLPDSQNVEIAVSGYRQQADMVRDGRADVALLSSPYDEHGLDSEPLITEPRVAALPIGHELARRRVVHCRDLEGETMPQWAGSTLAERVYWSGRDRGSSGGRFRPRRLDVAVQGPIVNDSTELLEVVSLGQAVALIPRSLSESNQRVDIEYRPVDDASPYAIAIAWPDGARARPIATFVRTALELTAGDRQSAVR